MSDNSLSQRLSAGLLRVSTASRNAREALAEGNPELCRAYLEVVIAASDDLEVCEPDLVRLILVSDIATGAFVSGPSPATR